MDIRKKIKQKRNLIKKISPNILVKLDRSSGDEYNKLALYVLEKIRPFEGRDEFKTAKTSWGEEIKIVTNNSSLRYKKNHYTEDEVSKMKMLSIDDRKVVTKIKKIFGSEIVAVKKIKENNKKTKKLKRTQD